MTDEEIIKEVEYLCDTKRGETPERTKRAAALSRELFWSHLEASRVAEVIEQLSQEKQEIILEGLYENYFDIMKQEILAGDPLLRYKMLPVTPDAIYPSPNVKWDAND